MKYLTFKNITWAAMAIVIIYLLTCNRKSVSPVVNIKPIQEQVAAVVHDSIISQHFKDSVQKIIESRDKEINYWMNSYSVADNELRALQNGISQNIGQQLPDTCKQYQNWIIGEYNKLMAAANRKDSAHRKIVAGKDAVIIQKDALIANGRDDYRKLRANLDTCFKQQGTLEKAIKGLKPRREVYIGATAIGRPDKPVAGYGLNLGLRNRKGTVIEVGALQIGPTINYTLSVKKPIFRF